MASLKEIKTRIQSVKSTQKITSAMKMVSSAKLRKAEKTIENFYPYQQGLNQLLNSFLSEEEDIISGLAVERDVKRIAVVPFSSNSSLCGGFNANVIKRMNQLVKSYASLGNENVLIYPVGKKVAKAAAKIGFTPRGNYESMADKPNYQAATELADELMRLFLNKEIDRVEFIYHHFRNKSSQVLMSETLLPIPLKQHSKGSVRQNYLVEPDRQTLMDQLVPKVIRLQIYTALLDSNASEHAARTMAMQIATDNANDLLQELSLQYNKSRQQAITNELLDILGGSFK
ncbi:MAG TPA: F0F1 ATP synthase subunit gamma [Paludibacter sp.]|nr:F0F1 ATP synthase subunit gamma [Paludibacter sp.]